jgi:hypothetical protein
MPPTRPCEVRVAKDFSDSQSRTRHERIATDFVRWSAQRWAYQDALADGWALDRTVCDVWVECATGRASDYLTDVWAPTRSSTWKADHAAVDELRAAASRGPEARSSEPGRPCSRTASRIAAARTIWTSRRSCSRNRK